MNNNAWFKKENPFQTVIGYGGGATGFGAHSSAASKKYVDDVFSTYVYEGSGSARSINNGIDLSGKGGLVWFKPRNQNWNHALIDSETGLSKFLQLPPNSATVNQTTALTSFDSSGFTLGADSNYGITNNNTAEYASWTFRKQKGFFDVVTYTGAGGTQTVNHNLGCVPGCIIIKRTDSTNSWKVYHRGTDNSSPQNYALTLNSNAAREDYTYWNDTAPTATQFTVADSDVNGNGGTFVAYLFAGGTTDATDKAVSFNGTDQKLTWAATSDFTFGTGAYTVEYWVYYDNVTDNDIIFSQYTNANGGFVIASTTGKVAINQFGIGDVLAYNTAPTAGVWTHYAFVRESTSTNKTYIFVNGELKQTGTDSTDWSTTQISALGGNAHPSSTQYTDCKISNFRITKGQALYTVPFNVPHDPLTTTSQGANSSDVKVICCNGDTVTASTVTPGTITAVGSPSQTTDNSIFDDTSAYVFGNDEDQGIIKTGKYSGNGNGSNTSNFDGPKINLGWEPQYVLIKNADAGQNWNLFDSMRGITTDANDQILYPSGTWGEDSLQFIDITSTGFNVRHTDASVNGSGNNMIYIAIRRPDGYVGKPPSAGTDVFTMDVGNSSAAGPAFDSNFVVDSALLQQPASAGLDWRFSQRLTGTKSLATNTTAAESTESSNTSDYNDGFADSYTSVWQSWMWKRGQGFDVVTWAGTNTSVVRRHNLGTTPEMIWFKNRDSSTRNWRVYHKGLNGGTNPENYDITLNTNNAEASNTNYMTSTAPTSTTFVSGNDGDTNGYGDNYIAMLFASANDAEGNPISKVGSYSGSGSTGNAQNIGFQPRFLFIKRTNTTGDWMVFDSLRGFGNYMQLNTTQQQYSQTYVNVSATGFSLVSDYGDTNESGSDYIYYAHA